MTTILLVTIIFIAYHSDNTKYSLIGINNVPRRFSKQIMILFPIEIIV